MCFERILQEVFKGSGLSMNFEQYVLVGSVASVTSRKAWWAVRAATSTRGIWRELS